MAFISATFCPKLINLILLISTRLVPAWADFLKNGSAVIRAIVWRHSAGERNCVLPGHADCVKIYTIVMSVYLIRHTRPLVEKGICYGHADLDVTESFYEEAAIIKQYIPPAAHVYSSPLTRCRKLAEHLYPHAPISWEPDLRELNCGEWEMKHWDAIPREAIDPWMQDFVNVCIPGGESYVQLYERAVRCYERIEQSARPAIIVAHGGVIRSILAHITGTSLKDSFQAFRPHYGCVIRVDDRQFEFLSNIPTEKEQHKPSAR